LLQVGNSPAPQKQAGGGWIGATGLLLEPCELVEPFVTVLLDEDSVVTLVLPLVVTLTLVELELVPGVVLEEPPA
jgi:hypothetical protein